MWPSRVCSVGFRRLRLVESGGRPRPPHQQEPRTGDGKALLLEADRLSLDSHRSNDPESAFNVSTSGVDNYGCA